MASPYSTGGGGTHLEARVVASCIAAVLCEAPVRGLPGEFATRVQTQRAAFGDPLDDVTVRGIQDGRETQLDLQIKNKLAFTESDEDWVDVLQRAWDTFSSKTFDRAVNRIGVGVGVYNARVDQHYQSVLTWASHSTDGQHFRKRIEKGDYSHKDKQAFVETVRAVLNRHVGRDLGDDEIWRFLSSFVIIHFDFQSGIASRDAANIVDRLKGMLSPANRAQATRIWDHLIAKAGELIPVGGGATRATLVQQLTGHGFDLSPAPSFWKDIVALQGDSDRALSDIKSHLHGLRLHRAEAYQAVREALADCRFIQIDGEPGTGKSALLKELAKECRRDGPVLVLKDTRIQPKGWASHAHVLGISADLPVLLREFACAGNPILFIDGIDKIVDPAIQLTVNDLLKAIAFDNALAQWRILVTVREQNLRHLETWLDPDALKKLPLKTVSVKALDGKELDIVATAFPRLRPLLRQSGNTDVILRRPFFLDAILSLAGRERKDQLPATEVELLKLWWDLGGSDRADFSPAQHRRNVLMQLAERLVAVPDSALAINDLSPEVIAELKSAGILRDKDLGHSVVFTHDIYEEWALCQLLIRNGPDLTAFLKNNSEPESLTRPVQLLGTYVLETGSSAQPWKALYDNTADVSLRPVWQRAILTSSLHSTRATQLLHTATDYLLENDGDRLKKMLTALATIEVVPNPIYPDEKLAPDLEPADRALLAHHMAVPKALIWVRFFDWLMPLMPKLPHRLIPELIPVFATWQTTFSGNKIGHCRQIGELAYRWLIEVEQAHHQRARRDRIEPFGGALNRRDVEKSLRALFLSSVGDVPELGSEYLQQKLADRESLHLFRGEILTNSGALIRHLPADLVDFVLGAFLEEPEEHIDRFSGYSDHLMEEHGLADEYQFYPASPLQLPFLGLLNWNEAEGLRLIRSVCNHAISIWRWQREQGGRSGRVHPVPLTLTFPWGQQTFWGDGQVYLWFRGTWGNNAVKSALMALDQWALTQCERGVPFEDVFRKVIEGNDSVAALGVGVSLCLAYAGKSLECAFPLVTCPYLWEWDISRLVQDSGFHSNEIGDWHRYRVLLNAVRKLNQYPHRRSEIRNLVVYFVCSGDEDLTDKYASAIRSFPENLPISYEEEKAHEGHLQALREKMTLFSEQGDPANFKTEPTADGEHIKIWNDPPSLKQEKYRSQQQQHTKRSEFMSVVVWAQNTLESGTVGKQLSIDDAVAKGKQWNQPGLFDEDDSDAFEHKQQTGAIVGAAFVAARYAESPGGTALLEWCQGVFDRAVSAIRKPSTWTARGSVLSMDSTVFAAHGYAALLARGQNVKHCQRALLNLATDPLEGVQAAVFNAAKYFALAHPAFYWVLLDLAIAQCIVPRDQIADYHSIVLDEREAKFKRELVERAESLLESGTISELPTIPPPWVKSGASPKSKRRNTAEYSRNGTVFLYNVAAKVLFHSSVGPALADPERRAKFLKMVGELLDYTIQEIVPPFANSRRDHNSHTPFEWVFGFSAWCGKFCAALTAAEARQVVFSRIFNQDAETALLMMQSVTRSFMIEAFLREKEITHDNMVLWSEITDWIFASPEWNHEGDREHLDREFVNCALSVLFCAAPDFSPLVCVVDCGWPHLSKFTQRLERAIKEFGTDRTLYLAVTTFLKKGGFDLLPKPALPWLGQIVQQKKADQVFWKTNGDETVELLRQLITEKGGSLSAEDRKAIILISDILTDNGVRGAGFLHQELLRAEKVRM
jgi:hypothetical protein